MLSSSNELHAESSKMKTEDGKPQFKGKGDWSQFSQTKMTVWPNHDSTFAYDTTVDKFLRSLVYWKKPEADPPPAPPPPAAIPPASAPQRDEDGGGGGGGSSQPPADASGGAKRRDSEPGEEEDAAAKKRRLDDGAGAGGHGDGELGGGGGGGGGGDNDNGAAEDDDADGGGGGDEDEEVGIQKKRAMLRRLQDDMRQLGDVRMRSVEDVDTFLQRCEAIQRTVHDYEDSMKALKHVLLVHKGRSDGVVPEPIKMDLTSDD